jgi:S1-C subfamily serine protease
VILGLNVVDWIIIALAVVIGYTGWTNGFVVGMLSFIGFVGGAVIGLWLVPLLLGGFEPGLGVSVLSVLLILGVAAIGQGLLAWAGAWVRGQVSSRPVRRFDAAGGAVLGIAGLLIASWAIGLAISSAAIPHASAAVRESRILRVVDDAVPVSPDSLRQAFQRAIAAGGFPEVVAPWVPEPILDVDEPALGTRRDPEIREAAESVIKIIGRAPACDRVIEGSGFVIGPERVMTNAHVVAGVSDPVVTIPDSDPFEAEVVLFDPDTDLAVLAVPGLAAPALAVASEPMSPAEDAAVVGYPDNGPLTIEPVRIRGSHQLLGNDIYGEDQVVRDVVSLRGEIRPGNSGGPLVSADGTVYGVVFAASLTDPDTGYALALSEIDDLLSRSADAQTSVSTGRCT